tara:strand:- start:283 stop:483 length:201 start_codon:yes stop_codon:yes gene_type:complete
MMMSVRKLNKIMKEKIDRKQMMERIKDCDLYKISPQDRMRLSAIICEYENQIQEIIEQFKNRTSNK